MDAQKQSIKMWRYHISTIDGIEGWGIFHLDSNGFFGAVTDYGNYAHGWWHHGCDDFREFFLDAITPGNCEYYLRKLSKCDVFDEEASAQLIKEHILEYRRHGSMTAEQARTEWDLANNLAEDGDKGSWYDSTSFDDAYEFLVYDYPSDAKAFVYRLLPRLAKVLADELNQEKPERAGIKVAL